MTATPARTFTAAVTIRNGRTDSANAANLREAMTRGLRSRVGIGYGIRSIKVRKEKRNGK